MKLYTEKQVKELLETQRGNCYVAILNHTKDEELAKIAGSAPQPAGEQFEQLYGIDPEKLYKEDMADEELAARFKGFESNLKSAKEKYNELVPEINSKIKLIANLKDLIVELSLRNESSFELSKQLNTIQADLNELATTAETFKTEIEKYKKLINNYKDWSERKLFDHWKYLTLFEATDKPWLDWKNSHLNIIM